MGRNLQLPASSNLFLEAELSSLICVYMESPERKHSQIEILHLKLIFCTNGKKKKKKVGNASLSGSNFWQSEVHRN